MAIQYDAKAVIAQRRQMVSSDYDPMRIGTPGYSEQLARGRPWDPPGDYSDDQPWLRQETSGDYDPVQDRVSHERRRTEF